MENIIKTTSITSFRNRNIINITGLVHESSDIQLVLFNSGFSWVHNTVSGLVQNNLYNLVYKKYIIWFITSYLV